MGIRFDHVEHDCDIPKSEQLPTWDDTRKVWAKWRCPICRTRWIFTTRPGDFNRPHWHASSRPSWRWRRAERKRLNAAERRGTATIENTEIAG